MPRCSRCLWFFLLAGLVTGSVGCVTSKTIFRSRRVHTTTGQNTCQSAMATASNPTSADLYDRGRMLLQVMNACIAPGVIAPNESATWCQFAGQLKMGARQRISAADAIRRAEKQNKDTYDRYRQTVEQRARKVRNVIQELQQQAPQSSMLYLLEARLYLLTGFSLDHQMYLLNGYDREAAQEWYRKAIPVARKAIEANKSYGLSFLYEAEALARLNRCEEATKKVEKLHKAGYKSSSTHALLAFCAISGNDDSVAADQIDKAVDAANREEAAAWANKYKKYLKLRKEWKERQTAARFSGQVEMVLDDSKDDVPFNIESVVKTQPKCLY